MKKFLIGLSISILFLFIIIPLNVNGTNHDEQSFITPPKNLESKFRIGFAQTDPYANYAGTFYGIIQGLASIGWVENVDNIPYTFGQVDSEVMWDWLATHQVSDYIEFVADAHYDFSEENTKERILKRIKERDDIDLFIVVGTTAGQNVATNEHDVPTLVFSTSDAVRANIIKSVADSGLDHVWAHVDPDRYRRQIEVFYDMFQFKKLGMIYENSDNGKIYAAYNDVINMAKERNFEVVEYHIKEPNGTKEDYERYRKEYENAVQKLSKQVDAMYLTANQLKQEQLANTLRPFYNEDVPVFSQNGSNEVLHGALLSLYRPNYNGIGRFGAEKIANIINGKKPRELDQKYGETPSIVLNLKVAEQINYKPPFEILLVADKIYQEINGDLEF